VGVGALIVALALANGFRDEMRDKILRGTAHLTVMRTDGQPMADYQSVASRLRSLPGVVGAAGTTYDGAVINGPKGPAYAVLRGIDRNSHQASIDIDGTVISGSLNPVLEPSSGGGGLANVMLGVELAARTGLAVGDVAEIMPASFGLSANSGRRRARVAGIFRSGLYEYDATWIYLPLETAATFTGGAHAASVISVQVTNIDEVKPIAARIRETLGPSYTTLDWQEANRPLFTALTLERRIGGIIIGLIILIAALNITTTLILLVVERRRDIAILGAMGAHRMSVMLIFIIEGAVIGAMGALLGIVFGAVATFVANRYQLISLPPDVYSISNVSLNLNFRDVFAAALVALVLSIVATIYPARAAARVRPAEMLRQ
ncbi:MAG TPA: FtsX-like permease family protein, partial [Pyrinomonadaceae bacterium]|nr:FtsX-like permease family protein [Pyrinomonadaceae bacterium]